MKTRFLNKMAGLLAVLLLFSCTGKFEEYNTDNTGFTDEQKTYDYNTFGVWLKVVQMGIYFNYDWGSGKNWHSTLIWKPLKKPGLLVLSRSRSI